VSRIPKYADDYMPTEEKSQSGSVVVNVIAAGTLLLIAFAALRFIGII